MKTVYFEYQKVGDIIMLDKKDWNRIVKFLTENKVDVQEKAVQKGEQRKARKAQQNYVKSELGEGLMEHMRESRRQLRKPLGGSRPIRHKPP